MKNTLIAKTLLATSIVLAATPGSADEFRRFSVSADWLHVMPQGNANPFHINTKVEKSGTYDVGAISPEGFFGALAPEFSEDNAAVLAIFEVPTDANGNPTGQAPAELLGLVDADGNIVANVTGTTTVNGIDQWTSAGTGL